MIILRNKQYSTFSGEGSIEQREFVSATTKLKAVIGRARKSLAKKLYESANSSDKKAIEINKNLKNLKPIVDKDLRNKILANEIPEGTFHHMTKNPLLKNEVYYHPGNADLEGTYSHLIEKLDKKKKLKYKDWEKLIKEKNKVSDKSWRIDDQLANGNDKRRNLILINKNSGVEDIAHEIGHAQDYSIRAKKVGKKEKDLKRRKSRGYLSSSDLRDIVKPGELENMDFKSSLKAVINNVKGAKDVLRNEKVASNNAIKMLKRQGATKDQLKQAKKNLDEYYKTYVEGEKVNLKSSLANLVDIPSRRMYKTK